MLSKSQSRNEDQEDEHNSSAKPSQYSFIHFYAESSKLVAEGQPIGA